MKSTKSRTCSHCGRGFVSYRGKFCSPECSQADKRKAKGISTCECCGSKFQQKYTWSRARTCSRSCWAEMRSRAYSDGRMLDVARPRVEAAKQRTESVKIKAEVASHCCCGWCGQHMRRKRVNQAFCEREDCRRGRAAGIERIRSYWSRPAERVCRGCGETFGRERPVSALYCSAACTKHVSRRTRRKRLRSGRRDMIGTKYIAKLFGYRCCHCGCECSRPTRNNLPSEASLDHIVPVSHGGRHVRSNMQLLCRACNMAKGDRWRESLCWSYIVGHAPSPIGIL